MPSRDLLTTNASTLPTSSCVGNEMCVFCIQNTRLHVDEMLTELGYISLNTCLSVRRLVLLIIEVNDNYNPWPRKKVP
jgi:hypothetical protein